MERTEWKRIISGLLAIVLVLGNIPSTALATDGSIGLCAYHEVHMDCSYDEGISDCNYVCELCNVEPKETTEPEAMEELAAPEETDENNLDGSAWSLRSGDQTSSLYPGSMPCIGNPNVLVFYVTLPGSEQVRWDLDCAGVEDMFFSETGESLRTYYERSSYGKVHIEGTVYEYTTQHDVYHYTDATMILDEIIEQHQSTINWDDYDRNNDGYIDGIYIIARTDVIWDGANFVSAHRKPAGNLYTDHYCLMLTQELSTLCHETCHMFGMPDIYVGTGMNPDGTNTSGIMDDGEGDIPGIMKLILGWIDNPVYISGEGTTNVSLNSISTNGELAIVYPNGNTENNNWMILEYLTEEANNRFSGVRVWKTNVVLDENAGVVGFHYLEAISPLDERNYYFSEGETVSPYTYPSTSYGVTYCSDGGFMTTNKYFDEIGFSGISISVNATNGECAELTVSIDNTIKDVRGKAVVTFPSLSDIIGDSTKLLIATVTSEQEMMLVGDVSLRDSTFGTVIPVEGVFSDYSNILCLYVSEDDKDRLEANKTYQINLTDMVKTYYGSDIDFGEFDGTIKIGNYGTAICAEGPYETPYFGLADFYAPDAFRIDSTHVMHFGYLNDVLFMRTHDITTQQYTDVTVSLNPPSGLLQIEKVLQIDGGYYAVLFRNDLQAYSIVHIAVYDLEGQLVDEYTPENALGYVGGNGHPIVKEKLLVKEIKIRDGRLVFETINYPFRLWGGTVASQYKLTDTLYAYADREYVPTAHTTVTLLAAPGEILSTLEFDNVRDVDLVYQDDKLYVVTAGQDLSLYVYDSNFALVEKKALMQQINKGTLWELKLGVVGESVWVSFYATPTAKTDDYYNSYLLVFTPNMLPQYYRYGDSSTTSVGNFAYVGKGIFFMGTQYPYYLLNTVIDDHDYTCTSSVVSPTCKDQGYTRYTCTICGDSYVDNYVDALGHAFENGICTRCFVEERLHGDIDGNEGVDVDDVLALLWNVLFPDDYPIEVEADFDGNGMVDVDDVLALLWHVLFPDDYPI